MQVSRSVRALELIRNATLLEGVLSEKENASVAAFFANPTNLTTNVTFCESFANTWNCYEFEKSQSSNSNIHKTRAKQCLV